MLSLITGGGNSTGTKYPKKKTMRDMLIDSGTIAAIALFSVWSGTPSIEQLCIVLKTAGISFFVQLAYERGIKKLVS